MKGEGHSEEKATPLPAAAIPVLDRYAGIFRGRKARLSRVRARSAPPKAPLTAAPRPQDDRRAIKDGPCVDGQAGPRSFSNSPWQSDMKKVRQSRPSRLKIACSAGE